MEEEEPEEECAEVIPDLCPRCSDVVWDVKGKGICMTCGTIVYTCCDG